MKKWWVYALGLYLVVCFLFFVKGKLKDPINPAGYMMPTVQQQILEIQKSDVKIKKKGVEMKVGTLQGL